MTVPCQHITDVMTLSRCLRPEDDEMHDPLGPLGRHVYDPLSWDDHDPETYVGTGGD